MTDIKLLGLDLGFKISAGAPLPKLLSNEHNLFVVFYQSASDQEIILVKFGLFAQFRFGDPNDEAIEGHRYYSIGLRPYTTYEVLNSEWIKELERMNRVHSLYKKENYDKYHHYIFYFHDSCLEVVSTSISIEKHTTSQTTLLLEIINQSF